MRFLVFIFVLLSFACEETNAPQPSDVIIAPEVIAARDYCETIAEGFCRFYMRCGRIVAEDQSACLSTFSETCEGRFEPAYVALEAASLLELSKLNTDACLAHLEDVQCELHPRDLDGVCGSMWQGLQGPDERCGFNLESLVCEEGTQCVLGLDLCGTCRPIAEIGEACDTSNTCGASALCREGVCEARVPLGEDCEPDDRCVLGASCREGTCRGPNYVALGAACDNDNRCPNKAHCEEGICIEDALLGEACFDTECTSGRCEQGLCLALASVGEACNFAADCNTLLCTDNVCAAPPSSCFTTN